MKVVLSSEVATYDGFWAPIDTLKERNAPEETYTHDARPWALWKRTGEEALVACRCSAS